MRPAALPWCPIALALVVLAGAAWPGLTEAWLYDRQAVAEGQWWRLWTASLVHLTWGHALLNLGGLLLVWFLFGPRLPQRAWCLAWFLSSAVVGGVLFWQLPEVGRYVGLSGALHGLFAAGALAELAWDRRWGLVFLAFLVGKLTYEQLLGPLPGSEAGAGGPVLVEAHLYGALGGLPVGLWGLWRGWRAQSSGD